MTDSEILMAEIQYQWIPFRSNRGSLFQSLGGIVHVKPVRINRILVNTEHLLDPFLRKMLENFVLADTDVVNCELLNLCLNPLQRRKRKAMNDGEPALSLAEEL